MKRIFYIFLAICLGFLLSLLLHIAIESIYLQFASNPRWYSLFGFGYDALPIWVSCMLTALGVLFGYWMGIVWWRIVYVEHRHWRTKHLS